MASASIHPQYRSTRAEKGAFSFEDALLQGLASDGGLFIPTAIPALDESTWRHASTFEAMAKDALSTWLSGEIDAATLEEIVSAALSFPVPLVPLRGEEWGDVYVLELFQGPTLSFKDFGARTMARLMAHFVRSRRQRLTILVATSGDTGSAVADGFAGLADLEVVLLYPKGQVSDVQEQQLIVERPGVRSFAVDGTFDDCQRMVKAAFLDSELRQLGLSSANSINIGRLLPQMLYYLWAIREGRFEEVVFCVPSGNLGNLTGGTMARLAGAPIRQFIAAHNANDFFPSYLFGGDEAYKASVRTLSNAMDVGAPSNFKRLKSLLGPEELRSWVWGTSVTDKETLHAMKHVYHSTGYVADPHTAVGLEAVSRYRAATGDRTPVVVLSTAHPAKFPDTIREALGFEPERPERLAQFWDRPIAVEAMNPTLEALKEALLPAAV